MTGGGPPPPPRSSEAWPGSSRWPTGTGVEAGPGKAGEEGKLRGDQCKEGRTLTSVLPHPSLPLGPVESCHPAGPDTEARKARVGRGDHAQKGKVMFNYECPRTAK